MSQYFINEETLTNIANAIRDNNGASSVSANGLIIKDEYIQDDHTLKNVNLYYRVNEAYDVMYEDLNYWQLAEYEYYETSDGTIAPIIYKLWDGGDTIDVEETFTYVWTDYGPDQVLYDWWIRGGESSGDYASTYILTDCIITEASAEEETTPISPEEMPQKIADKAYPLYLYGTYVLKKDPSNALAQLKSDQVDVYLGEYADGMYGAIFYDYYYNYGDTYQRAENDLAAILIVKNEEIVITSTDGYGLRYVQNQGWSWTDGETDVNDELFFETPISRMIIFSNPYKASPEFYYAFLSLTESVVESEQEQYDKYIDGTLRAYIGPRVSYNIRPYAFTNNQSIELIDFNRKCSKIGSYAFEKCNNLQYVLDLDYNGLIIESCAFQSCANLKQFNANGVASIGSYAFRSCSQLTSLSICGSQGSFLTYTIGREAFDNCSNISSIYLRGCSHIGSNAFVDCSNLQTVKLSGNGVTTLGTLAAFPTASTVLANLKIFVPKSLYAEYATNTQWSSYSMCFMSY